MTSPFPYDSITTLKQFFGRDKEIEKISQIVKYSNNMLIHSKRRMGKSSLIEHFFKLNQDKYLCIYIDIFDVTSKESFAKSMLQALSNAQKSDLKTTIKNLTTLFKRVRVEPTIDPNTLEYSIKPIVATLSFEEMIDDFFHTLDELSKKQQIVLAIDEFQQIATITDVKLDALLRKHIQKSDIITIEQIDDAIKEIINSKDSSYRIVFDTLNNNQKTALKIVGKYKKGFFANSILNEYNIKKQTLQSSVEALFKKELIDKEDDRYFIPNRTFELWVERF